MSDRAQGVESQIRELKVSGHTMALEPGLYCVYNAPGGPMPGPAGLPGVRITTGPGAGHGRITVSTFTQDGWIGADSAALVRVQDGPAELLVTVYQARDAEAEAPKLQVVLLSGEATSAPAQAAPADVAAAPKAAPAPAKPKAAPAPAKEPAAAPGKVEVVAHVYGRGDLAGELGAWMNEPGSQRWIEGFGIAPSEGVASGDIEYQAVLGRGWLSPWSQGGQFCGSRGMSLPILGLRVRLRGEAATTHRVVLSASFVDGTKVGPVGDGEPCEAPSLAALEAFQIALEPLATGSRSAGAPAPKGRRGKAAAPPAPEPVPAAKPGRAAKAKAAAAAPVVEPPKARGKPGPKPKAAMPAPSPKAEPAKPAAAKPAQAKTAQAKLAAAKPAAAKPVAAKPVAAKPAARAAKRTPATTRRR